MNIVIGGAWPYANGPLHIGHIAALLPGDILARFNRQIGNSVSFVSGSDCHGTPILIRAKKEGKTPIEISDYYHREFIDCFRRLGFSYDYYGKTSDEAHKCFITKFHQKLYQSNSVVEKTEKQAYCNICAQFLPDRFVKGHCPKCGKSARGDQCEHCGIVLDSFELVEPLCATCDSPITHKPSAHLYLRLSDFTDAISGLINDSWRKNAVDFTNRYINEGLRERALTRDIECGIDVPKKGYEGKKIYIWAENVLGYLSSCAIQCHETGENFDDYWKSNNTYHYYVHGKDNIPFHSVILPALLLAEGSGYHLPDSIISSEYMTLDGKKISTSENHAVWIADLLDCYNPDAIRYFFISNAPEKRDADFSFNAFKNSTNGELLGVYGNFVNRSLVFIAKYFDGVVPCGTLDLNIQTRIEQIYETAGNLISCGDFKEALFQTVDLARFGNKYFDNEQPWITRENDNKMCSNTLFQCVQIIANLSVLLEPFIPFSTAKVQSWLNISNEWKFHLVEENTAIPETEILFKRIE